MVTATDTPESPSATTRNSSNSSCPCLSSGSSNFDPSEGGSSPSPYLSHGTKKESDNIVRIDAIDKRVFRAFKNVAKMYFFNQMTSELKSDPNLFVSHILQQLQQFSDLIEDREKLLMAVGLVTYLTIKTKSFDFIDTFPLELFTQEELVRMKRYISKYLDSNERCTTARTRRYLVSHVLTQLGKHLYNTKFGAVSKAFDDKVYHRLNVIVQDKNRFEYHLNLGIDRVPNLS